MQNFKTDDLDFFHSSEWMKSWRRGIYNYLDIELKAVEAETWDRVYR